MNRIKMALIVMAILSFAASPSFALPSDNQIPSGGVISIDSPTNGTATITTSTNSIINFDSFFIIPNPNAFIIGSTSMMLGRVINQTSIITNGAITVSGNIILLPLRRVTSTVKVSCFYYTNEIAYWGNSNVIAKRSSATRLYNKDNQLMWESGYEYTYDINGRPDLSSPFRRFNNTYTYNQSKQLINSVLVDNIYDAKGKLTSYRTVKAYTYCANGDSYVMNSTYGSDGKLLSQGADITVVDGAQTKNYYAFYGLDQAGQITYTSIYQNDNGTMTLVTNLSGQGYKGPADIIASIRDPFNQRCLIRVNGDIFLNSNKSWDLTNIDFEVSGTFNLEPRSGSDIHVVGDVSIERGTLDLGNRWVNVTGNLTLGKDAKIITSGFSIIHVGGDLYVDSHIEHTGDFSVCIVVDGSISTGSNIETTGNVVIEHNGRVGIEPWLSSDKAGFVNGPALRGDASALERNAVIESSKTQLPQGVSLSGEIALKSNSLNMKKLA